MILTKIQFYGKEFKKLSKGLSALADKFGIVFDTSKPKLVW